MLKLKRQVRIETERLTLRPPVHSDFRAWSDLRRTSRTFLKPWEPSWAPDHLGRKAFANRVYWSNRAVKNDTALPLFMFRRDDTSLVGAITLDHIRRGPAQAGTLGYWIGEQFARQGFMREAIEALVHHCFHRMDLSRIEAACLPENRPSRDLLEKCGFKYEGVAQSYLEIDGRWRTHVLYACIRLDRRGRTEPI
ncbi:GNAT family N-acetyltransferase [Thalassovita aquimarina]|uniref:GNAT family N-acetyltransferase n=1 Tax=Thalassovita aquimarina TaxID=2785917 RepID=A0ABS5HVR7_9RHOB|nr:GNAT family protein [Thalassovita aquimarina]MBR9653048.1 GNAT family N-acetyltransferase [Thalassovita aquimarina]